MTTNPKEEPVIDLATERDRRIGILLDLLPVALPKDTTQHKKLAIKSYMRNWLSRLTNYELDFEFKSVFENKSYSSDALFKITKASKGYDLFMERKGLK